MDVIQKDAKVHHAERGFGTFIEWFQGSEDIAVIKWSHGSKTVVHKRYLTEVETDIENESEITIPSERVETIIDVSSDELEKIKTLYNTYRTAPAILLNSDKPTMAQYAKNHLLNYLESLLKSKGISQRDIEDGKYSFDFDEMKFTEEMS